MSLRQDEFDGLNNMLQIPFSLPWFMLPIGLGDKSHVARAWIDAGWGALNALFLYLWFAREGDLAEAKRRLAAGGTAGRT